MIKSRRGQEKPMDKVNLTSMTDVLLTLLILFMVLETAKASLGFNLKLPSVVAVAKPEDPTIVITYSGKRKLFVTTTRHGDVQMQREKLRGYLAKLGKQFAYENVIIRGDSKLKYKEIIGIMDDAKRAGFENISLATRME